MPRNIASAAESRTARGKSSTSGKSSPTSSSSGKSTPTSSSGKSSPTSSSGKSSPTSSSGKSSPTSSSGKSSPTSSSGKSSVASSSSGKSSSTSSSSGKSGKSSPTSSSSSKACSSKLPSSLGKPSASSLSSGDRQKSIGRPKCTGSKSNQACRRFDDSTFDDFSDAFSNLRLTDDYSNLYNLPKDHVRGHSKKKEYNVAKKEAPEKPGIYKFYRTGENLEAYIGHSINLRQRIYQHAYGTQDVDEFLREEGKYVEVETELSPTKDDARLLEKRKLMAFKEKHGHLPEFNHRI